MQPMTLMALMLEITTSTSTTTMELSAVTIGDENIPFDGLGVFVVDRFCERIHNSQCTTFQAKLAGCCCFKERKLVS